MKKHLLFLPLILLLVQSCFALDAKFAREHACMAVRVDRPVCRINVGDMLTKDALINYHDARLHTMIKKANASKITSENHILAGDWIVIPELPMIMAHVQSHAIATHAATLASSYIHTAMLETEPPPELTAETSEEIAEMTLAASSPFVPSSTTVVMEPNVSPLQSSLPTSNEKAVVKQKKLTGYQLVIPHSRVYRVDGTPLIPIGLNLSTQIGIFNNVNDPAKGIAPVQVINTTARVAKRKDKEVVLTVLLPQDLPTQTYVVRINGIGGIGGKEFTSNAEPFYGHFPTQHHILGTLLGGGSFVGSGLMLTGLLGGPAQGFGAAAGMWGTQWTIHHVRMAVLRRAEIKYQARAKIDQLLLAERQTTQKEELKHAE